MADGAHQELLEIRLANLGDETLGNERLGKINGLLKFLNTKRVG